MLTKKAVCGVGFSLGGGNKGLHFLYLFAQGPPGPGGLPGEQGKVGPPVSDSSDWSLGFSLLFVNNVNKQHQVVLSFV